MAFALTQESTSLLSFCFEAKKRLYVPPKIGTRDFSNSPPFMGSVCFYVTITGDFERFQYLNFETGFLKN